MVDPFDISPSLKHKLKKSICCCFRLGTNTTTTTHQYHHHRRTTSAIQRLPSRTTSHEFPECKGKFRHLISRIGSRRRAHSTDFRYDPLSYALNFDEGGGEDPDSFATDAVEASHFGFRRHFSARLPNSSPVTHSLPRMPASAPAGKAAVMNNRNNSLFKVDKEVGGTGIEKSQRSSSTSSDSGVVAEMAVATVGMSREIAACS